MKALCVLGLMQEVAAAGAGSGVGAKSWASVDVGRLERDGVDVDFYKVQVDVHASSPYLNKLTSVELCSRWTQVADAMQPERYLQVATSPIMYTNVVSFLRITVGVENCPSPKHDAQRVLVTCVQCRVVACPITPPLAGIQEAPPARLVALGCKAVCPT
jgi:hypothetical protein